MSIYTPIDGTRWRMALRRPATRTALVNRRWGRQRLGLRKLSFAQCSPLVDSTECRGPSAG